MANGRSVETQRYSGCGVNRSTLSGGIYCCKKEDEYGTVPNKPIRSIGSPEVHHEATRRTHGSSNADIKWQSVTGIAVMLLPPTRCLVGRVGDRTGRKVKRACSFFYANHCRDGHPVTSTSPSLNFVLVLNLTSLTMEGFYVHPYHT